jgi:hypothetical protein
MFFIVNGTVKPVLVTPVEPVDYLLGYLLPRVAKKYLNKI